MSRGPDGGLAPRRQQRPTSVGRALWTCKPKNRNVFKGTMSPTRGPMFICVSGCPTTGDESGWPSPALVPYASCIGISMARRRIFIESAVKYSVLCDGPRTQYGILRVKHPIRKEISNGIKNRIVRDEKNSRNLFRTSIYLLEIQNFIRVSRIRNRPISFFQALNTKITVYFLSIVFLVDLTYYYLKRPAIHY